MVPSKVKVAGIEYNVSEINRLVEDYGLQGQVFYHKGLIKIDANMSNDKKQQTFVHELFHAILNEAGYDEQDEDLVNRVSIVLYQVLKDNKLTFDN